jgi:hypothetical protein
LFTENAQIKGRYLFPAKAGSDAPCFANWADRATNDLIQLKGWWGVYRECNWNMLTGMRSGIVTLKAKSEAAEARIRKLIKDLKLPKTLTTVDANGSTFKHRHYSVPSNGKRRYLPACHSGSGFKLISSKSYVAVPPSTCRGGVVCKFQDPLCPVAEMPSGIVSMLNRSDCWIENPKLYQKYIERARGY